MPSMMGRRSPTSEWILVGLICVTASLDRPALFAEEPRPPLPESGSARAATQAAIRSARLTVTVPQEDTILSLDGRAVVGMGTTRQIETPPIGSNERRSFTLTATWNPNTYTTMTRATNVPLGAGEHVTVDLTRDDAGDRVRVIYVPTPADVAGEMVRLAGVGPGDVVYEPGCGDARITIAALRAGATRGICVDLDPERAKESQANVQQAGLADRIDVRLGDALDVKDLSEVTVVLLYMGDHFNMLVRPVLWRELAPGARVVSHRFTMGDWQPDKTMTVHSDEFGGSFDLHLWTITEEVKRRKGQ
jgi:uncharacterized protein (TIGR03000 family)